jgi:hypothetical protein
LQCTHEYDPDIIGVMTTGCLLSMGKRRTVHTLLTILLKKGIIEGTPGRQPRCQTAWLRPLPGASPAFRWGEEDRCQTSDCRTILQRSKT